MTSTSPTPGTWDERHRHLCGLSTVAPVVAQTVSIDIEEMVVGDQLLISGQPFIVIGIAPDGAVIHVEATRETRVITNEYLRIESVDVLAPRPPAALDRKASA
jgi:hypothetical protein